MTKVFIIHGAYGNPQENWFPWLKKELKKQGNTVYVPRFPTPKNQSLDSWMKVFRRYEKHLDENSIIIGHSVGCAFILNVLEQKSTLIHATFFVSGFTGQLRNDKFDILNSSFANKKFNWKAIRKNCREWFSFHSDNDPYVPLQKAKELAKNLGTKVMIIKNAGHFNNESGYTTFNKLLQEISNINTNHNQKGK